MEEMMRKMQNMGKAQFMEETRKIRSAWVEEAVKRCSPYAPDGIRKELLQAAAIFCYVCALEPKKEAETVCKRLMNAFTMPEEDQIPAAVKFLNERYRDKITGSVAFYLPYLFEPAGTRNFAMRQLTNHVLEYCRRQMKQRILTLPELTEYESRCEHLKQVREQLKRADATAGQMEKYWKEAHIFYKTIRFQKDMTASITQFLADPAPEKNPDYKKTLLTHTFPNGANLTFSLQCVKRTASTEVMPALVASVSAGTGAAWKAIYDIRKHGILDIDAEDCTYCLQLEYYKPSDFVYESSGKRRALKHLEYPKNLIGEILDTENPKEPTEFMKKELDAALAKLDQRNQDFILSYFRDGKTYREIGETRGLSPSRVREVMNRGIRKLRIVRLCRILQGETITEQTEPAEIKAEPDEIPIESCNFSTRLYNCLRRAGILTISELRVKSWSELCLIRNFGVACQTELEQFCEKNQIILKSDN